MSNLSLRSLLTITLAIALSESSSRATIARPVLPAVSFDVIPSCRLPEGVVAHSDAKDMPAPLTVAVKQKLGYLVSPTGRFDATDVIRTGHDRRLIFIWVRGNVWVVATEHGGMAYNDPILVYQLDSRGLQATLVAERIAFPKTVCTTATELLNQLSIAAQTP